MQSIVNSQFQENEFTDLEEHIPSALFEASPNGSPTANGGGNPTAASSGHSNPPPLEELEEVHNAANNGAQSNESKPKKPTVLRADGDYTHLSISQEKTLLKSLSKLNHKVAVLLMVDCGLRISETITLQLKNFDFKKKVVLINSLKKRGKDSVREIPLSVRLLNMLADYLKEVNLKTPDAYIFPGNKNNAHITRKAFNQLFDRLKAKHPELSEIHPHALRHTFATKLVNSGSLIQDVKTLLGHNNLNTTLIYTHTPVNIHRQNIENAISHNDSKFRKWWNKKFGRKDRSGEINFVNTENNFTVGRTKELAQVYKNMNDHVNTILIGGIGIGKTHLLNQVKGSTKNILMFDDLSNLKTSFAQLLLYLYKNDKEEIFKLMYGNFSLTEVKLKISRDSVANIIEEILKITEKKEYILLIDNVDSITAKGMKAIEQIKDHFTIITATRNVAINKTNFIWNFERIEIKNLGRTEALQLITKNAFGQNIEHPDVYRNHIFDQSQGNPRVINEMVEKYSRETFLTNEVIRNFKHIGGLPEIDMSIAVIVLLALTALMRYTSHQVGQELYRFIGGLGLITLMLWRLFLSKSRRKFL
jgi:integrase/recombinase XerD